MANIILQINTRGKKYVSPYVIIKTSPNKRLGDSGVETYRELVITPINNYVLDAGDFYSGALPSVVRSITYTNRGDNVVVGVELNKAYLTTSTHQNVVLPVNGIAKLSSSGFSFTDKSSSDASTVVANAYNSNTTLENTITRGDSVSSKFAVKGSKGGTVLILQKEFIAPLNYYFQVAPSFKLNVEDKNNYRVVVKTSVDDENRIISKTFDVFYTFSDNLRFRSEDDIEFFGNAIPIPVEEEEEYAKDSKTEG